MAAAKATPKQKASKALKQAGKLLEKKKLAKTVGKAKAKATAKGKAAPPQRLHSKQSVQGQDPRAYSMVTDIV